MPKESNTDDVSQWISNIVCIDDRENDLKLNVGKVVGPPTIRKLEQQYSIQVPGNSPSSFMRTNSLNEENLKNEASKEDDEYIHYIIVKIPEKVFIDSLDIYETACEGALVKIEAQENDSNSRIFFVCSCYF